MRRAAEKLAAGPHVLATIRTGAARPDRASAAAAARSVAGGFATVARHLRPVRMWRPVGCSTRGGRAGMSGCC
jgi:hypothetical protein